MERIVLQEKKSLLLSIATIFILFSSCTIYQNVPVEDGIYTSKKKKEVVVLNEQEYEDYEDNYFTKKLYELENANDDDLFTDVDSYFSDDSRTDTVYVNQQPWGQNNNTVVINFDRGWGFDPYWNDFAFWNSIGGIGWTPFYGRPWGWNRGWGWNGRWGFRRGWAFGFSPFNFFYGPGFYDPFWGWRNPYFYGGFGFNRFHRNRSLAFNSRAYRYGRVYNNGRPRIASINRNSYNRRTILSNRSRRVATSRNRNTTRTRPNNSTRTRVRTTNPRRNSSTRTRTNSTRTRSRSYTPSRRSSSTRSSSRSRGSSSSRSRGSSGRRGN